ncbi:hypothetical protein EV178_006216 [Coemansia sp. RSA 1646]|nr:hypothetical protein EV178_006216 [Coemansia sp. RSA 1646]
MDTASRHPHKETIMAVNTTVSRKELHHLSSNRTSCMKHSRATNSNSDHMAAAAAGLEPAQAFAAVFSPVAH